MMDIDSLHARNQRVEADKAWETSLARRLIIAALTYLTIVVFFIVAELPNPWTNALVPTIGFFLSTLTMPIFKKLWMKWCYKKLPANTKKL